MTPHSNPGSKTGQEHWEKGSGFNMPILLSFTEPIPPSLITRAPSAGYMEWEQGVW
jgi:hypothetical protein